MPRMVVKARGLQDHPLAAPSAGRFSVWDVKQSWERPALWEMILEALDM